MQESTEVSEFFKDIPDDQKRSIEKLTLKIKSLLGERSKLESKCAGLENQRNENLSEIENYRKVHDEDKKALLDNRN